MQVLKEKAEKELEKQLAQLDMAMEIEQRQK